jgi:hypothetical protein
VQVVATTHMVSVEIGVGMEECPVAVFLETLT